MGAYTADAAVLYQKILTNHNNHNNPRALFTTKEMYLR
jgi:hypothetical protein